LTKPGLNIRKHRKSNEIVITNFARDRRFGYSKAWGNLVRVSIDEMQRDGMEAEIAEEEVVARLDWRRPKSGVKASIYYTQITWSDDIGEVSGCTVRISDSTLSLGEGEG
jgi:hypothetical protein